MYTPGTCSVCHVLNAGKVWSPQGLGCASNPRVTKAKTIDPLHRTMVTPIMALSIPTTAPGEETCGKDRTTPPTYSPTQVDEPPYASTYARAFVHTLTRWGGGESG
jgi:hypothetical protein